MPHRFRTTRFCHLAATLVAATLLGGCASLTSPARPDVTDGRADVVDMAPPPPASRYQNAFYQVLLGEVAARRGDWTTALQAYMDAMALSPDADVAKRATRMALYTNDLEQGTQAARRWLELDPDSLEAREVLALFEMRAGRIEEAARQLRPVLSESEGFGPSEGFTRLGALFAREQQLQPVVELLTLLRQSYPGVPEAHYVLAQFAAKAGDLGKALTSADEALALRPDWRAPYLLKSQILMQAGQTEAALDVLGQGLAIREDDYEMRLRYARLLVNLGRMDQAFQEFNQLLEVRPDDDDVKYATALLALEAKRTDLARTLLLELINSGDHVNEAYYQLGRVSELDGDTKGALRWYGEVEGELRSDAQLRSVVMLARDGEIELARSRLAALRNGDGEMAIRSYMVEAQILLQAGRDDDAWQVYERAVQAFPGQPDLLYARALTAVKLGRIEQAEEDLRAILRDDPDNAQAKNALGYTLVDSTDRIEEGFALIKEAYEAMPDDPAVIDSMGWAKYRLGELDEALIYLREAHGLSSEAEIAYHLALVLIEAGREEEAGEVVLDALALHPEDERLLTLKQRLGL